MQVKARGCLVGVGVLASAIHTKVSAIPLGNRLASVRFAVMDHPNNRKQRSAGQRKGRTKEKKNENLDGAHIA
jgi:hypothetical protein